MKKNLKRAKKLHLHRETISVLTREEIVQAEGGHSFTCYFSCAYGCQTIGFAAADREQQPCTF